MEEDELLNEIIIGIQKVAGDLQEIKNIEFKGQMKNEIKIEEKNKKVKVIIDDDDDDVKDKDDKLNLKIFEMTLQNLENEYSNVIKKIQQFEKQSKLISVDERKQEILQKEIDSNHETLKKLKTEIFKRKYSEKAFYEYFFNRIQEPYPSLKQNEQKNRRFELKNFLNKFIKNERENNWIIEMNKITKRITGIENENFIEILKKKTKKYEKKDEKELKILKEKLTLIQKRYKLLERSYRKYFTRKIKKTMAKSNQSSSVPKKTTKLIDHFKQSSFQLKILESNLREHEEMIDYLNDRISTFKEDQSNHHLKSIEPIAWFDNLDFKEMSEIQKEKFLIHFEKLNFPTNLIIKNQFQLNMRNNFMNFYSNFNFWNSWYQNRQFHEYVKFLKKKFYTKVRKIENLNGIEQNFNLDFHDLNRFYSGTEPPIKNDEIHDSYFFDENFFMENFNSILTEDGNQNILWKNQNSFFIYKKTKNKEANENFGNLIGSSLDWLKVYKSRKILLKSIFEKESIDILKRKFDLYIFHLCGITSQKSMTSSFLSHFWSSKQIKNIIEREEQETKIIKKDEKNEKLKKFLKQKISDYFSDISISSFLISSKIMKKLKVYLNLLKEDPLKFQKKLNKSKEFKCKMYQFLFDNFSAILLDNKKIKLNFNFFELSLRNRLINDFDFKLFQISKLKNIIIDEMNNFNFIENVKSIPKMKRKKNEKELLKDLPPISNIILQQNDETVQQRIRKFKNDQVHRIKREDLDDYNQKQIEYLREK
eukprot:gene6344-10351_t